MAQVEGILKHSGKRQQAGPQLIGAVRTLPDKAIALQTAQQAQDRAFVKPGDPRDLGQRQHRFASAKGFENIQRAINRCDPRL